jgi:predicted acylesterase/phospholipase RssA
MPRDHLPQLRHKEATMTERKERAHAFFAGTPLMFDEANALWKDLKTADEISLARRVLERLRDGRGLVDKLPADRKTRHRLCQQEALLTSKDPELSTARRHDRALEILSEEFDLQDPALDGDAETLGIAGGILKRRWNDLGQIEDLRKAARLYERGAGTGLGEDAYTQINAAFIDDLLAQIGDDPVVRKQRAAALRERILKELPPVERVSPGNAWFNTVTRAEALFGLRRYAEATQVVATFKDKPAPWELETTARQIAALAHMHDQNPLAVPEMRGFFEALLPGAPDAARSAVAGKVGLALSGGGFRAAFYHLGVLARLAELNVLRHIEVLSCVSGGSIAGACYWLALRNRLLQRTPPRREDYIELVRGVIQHFLGAVSTNLRGSVQPSEAGAVWRFLSGEKGALDCEETAVALEERFYRPLLPGDGRPFMHQLPFTPADHNPSLAGSSVFNPSRHNWLRTDKVPVLVLNATTVNTGHAWQFTPTWMGESPWAVHEAAESIPRLEWSWYEPKEGWQMELGRAVAASACVPAVFAPLEIEGAYQDVRVHLVDGGVHDNQGTVSLLALNCNVLLVSDACGQLLLEERPAAGLKGLAQYMRRSMDTLIERVRLANYSDLALRRLTNLLRGLMFVHMKAGLDTDTIRLRFSQEPYDLHREPLSPSGVRKDFQQALAELRTDLDAFTADESHALMACGYRMSLWAFQRDLAAIREIWDEPATEEWPFSAMLQEITSTAATTPRRDELLAALREGSKVRL